MDETNPHPNTSTQEPVGTSLDSSTHPRLAIRTYLRDVLIAMGMDEEQAASWPDVPRDVFHRYTTQFDGAHAQLHAYLRQSGRLVMESDFYVQLYGQVTSEYLRLDWRTPEVPALLDVAEDLFDGRPRATLELNQQYCTTETTMRRAHLLSEYVSPEEGKVFCLGDDDLVSVALSTCFSGEIHMLDLDDRLLSFIGERAPSVQRHKIDLESGMPRDFRRAFDAILLDPHWYYHGARYFLHKALYCMKDEPDARIFLCLCPLFTGDEFNRFQKRVLDIGLVFEDIRPFFNWYDLSLLGEPNARTMLGELLEFYDSALLRALIPLPYGFSHMFVLKRAPGHRPNRFKQWLFDAWHAASG